MSTKPKAPKGRNQSLTKNKKKYMFEIPHCVRNDSAAGMEERSGGDAQDCLIAKPNVMVELW